MVNETWIADVKRMNEDQIKERTFKLNSFKEFPFIEMTKIVAVLEQLGYSAKIIDNGNIVFNKK